MVVKPRGDQFYVIEDRASGSEKKRPEQFQLTNRKEVRWLKGRNSGRPEQAMKNEELKPRDNLFNHGLVGPERRVIVA